MEDFRKAEERSHMLFFLTRKFSSNNCLTIIQFPFLWWLPFFLVSLVLFNSFLLLLGFAIEAFVKVKAFVVKTIKITRKPCGVFRVICWICYLIKSQTENSLIVLIDPEGDCASDGEHLRDYEGASGTIGQYWIGPMSKAL